MLNQLHIITSYGQFSIALDFENAPHTSNFFKDCVQRGAFNDSRIFRIVTEANAKMRQDARIEVIQAGVFYEAGDDFFHLKHEPTHETGLSHIKWTVSAARYDVGQNYPSFFICMRDEPVLDHGGARHPDGQGFAAFGTLIAGFDVVEKIYAQAESEEFLKKNIKIKSASFA